MAARLRLLSGVVEEAERPLLLPRPYATLVSDDACGRVRHSVTEQDFRGLAPSFDPPEPSVLRRLSRSFCPQCDSCYCAGHWNIRDDVDAEGWHDGMVGTCPEGHRVALDD